MLSNHPFSTFISSASPVVPFLVGIFVYRKLSIRMKLLWVLFLFTVITEGANLYLSYNSIQNLWLFLVYSIVEFVFLFWIMHSWQQSTTVSYLFLGVVILYVIVVPGIQVLYGPGSFYLQIFTIRSIVLSAAIIYMLLALAVSGTHFTQNHQFWVLISFLLINGGTALLYGISIVVPPAFFTDLYKIVHSGLNTISNLMMAWAFYVCSRYSLLPNYKEV